MNPLKNFLDTPIALVYVMKDGTRNVMTNGAWTWYSNKNSCGTIHEFGNHSFTYEAVEEITHMSMIFLHPTLANVKLLKYFGGNSGYDVDKLAHAHWDSILQEDEEGFLYHPYYSTWCVTPIDTHKVIDYFKLVTTRFVKQYNGYPHERIIDEDRIFYKLVKEEIK